MEKPKRQRTFLKFERSLLNREMANSDQHYEILFYLERYKYIYCILYRHIHTFTQVSKYKKRNQLTLLHFKFACVNQVGQTKTYFTRQSISLTSTLQTYIFPIPRCFKSQIYEKRNLFILNASGTLQMLGHYFSIVYVAIYCIRLHIFGKITL